ncbi:hypothetical protein BD309DRAFT_965091 [Dichomitus squalens]|nr:hypothetical protein BD309DRAFT_965091 [Dichomitus squalens]
MATRRGRFRTKLCRNYALGHCPQGDKCNYIHASPESIQTNIISPLLQPSLSQRSADDQFSSTTFSPSLWPTISPVTNASSDHFGYNWDTSTTAVDTSLPPSRMKYRPLSWRTTLCRHFLKNRGWCPLGEDCNYIHDLTLAEFAKNDVRFSRRGPSSTATAKRNERGKAGSKHSHCWAYIQGLCHVQDCQYLHPVAAHMFAAHTPCLAWPNCRRGPLCPYKHPEPYISSSPQASPVQHYTAIHPPPSQPDTVPRGAMLHNGMFYFNVGQPQPMAPSILQPPAPPLSGPQPPVVFTNPWETWPIPFTPPAGMAFTPFAFNPPTWQGVVPVGLADSGAGQQPMFSPVAGPQPTFDLAFGEPRLRQSMERPPNHPFRPAEVSATQRTSSFSVATAPPAPETEFPYVPPKNQRVGHARRVSVTIKSKEDLDALGLDSSSSHGRLPWQTHADRVARRSWAPSSSSFRTGQATPPPVLYGL